VTFVSRQEAYRRFKQRLGSDADLLEGLGADVLPASLEIRLKPERRHDTAAVAERLSRNKAFGELHYGREWLERFEAFLLLLRTVGVALGGFLVLAALVIVANTIKLTLYARQDELEAMTMVGATSLFIKLPYLIEGALQGLCGGLLAMLVSFVAFRIILRESLGSLLLLTGIDTIHFLPPAWQGLLVAAGAMVGLLGSLLALRKFVRFCQD
jgi:cell division transport system permease protein